MRIQEVFGALRRSGLATALTAGSAVALISAVMAADPPGPSNQQAGGNRHRGHESARFLQTSSTGDVLWTSSPHAGRLHLTGGLALYTGDYFRARYGGVPADLDRLSYRLRLAATIGLLPSSRSFGPLEALSISATTLNAFTDTPVPNEDIWYTSDRAIGLGAAFGGGFLAGLTYTAYKNPFSPPGVPREVAFALRYSGDHWLGSLQPQAKAAVTVGQGTGYVVQLSITPAFKPFESFPLTLTTPIAVGAGFAGYYGTDVDEGYYAEFGLIGTVPLELDAPGRWALSAGSYLTLRTDPIVRAAPRFDDAGNAVVVGFVALSYTY